MFVLVCSVNLAVSDDLPGHMKPLGSHLPPLEIETLDSPPDPLTFYSYVKQNLPVKLKGLLKDNEVLKNWENDDYLKYVLINYFGDHSATFIIYDVIFIFKMSIERIPFYEYWKDYIEQCWLIIMVNNYL